MPSIETLEGTNAGLRSEIQRRRVAHLKMLDAIKEVQEQYARVSPEASAEGLKVQRNGDCQGIPGVNQLLRVLLTRCICFCGCSGPIGTQSEGAS